MLRCPSTQGYSLTRYISTSKIYLKVMITELTDSARARKSWGCESSKKVGRLYCIGNGSPTNSSAPHFLQFFASGDIPALPKPRRFQRGTLFAASSESFRTTKCESLPTTGILKGRSSPTIRLFFYLSLCWIFSSIPTERQLSEASGIYLNQLLLLLTWSRQQAANEKKLAQRTSPKRVTWPMLR